MMLLALAYIVLAVLLFALDGEPLLDARQRRRRMRREAKLWRLSRHSYGAC